MFGPCFNRRGVVGRGVRERRVKVVLGDLWERPRRPEEGLRLRGGLEGRAMVEREEAPLQLADPVPAGGERQARMLRQASLERALVEVVAVERREARASPRSTRISRSCVVRTSTTRPNFALRAKASASSAVCSTSRSGTPAASSKVMVALPV